MSTSDDKNHYALPNRSGKTIAPLHDDLKPAKPAGTANAAADLIRQKLDTLYKDEPSAKEEMSEVAHVKQRSKHQQYMYDLSHSGKSLAEIQSSWHKYYTELPNSEKHEVWQEFYANHQQASNTPAPAAPEKSSPASHHIAQKKSPATQKAKPDTRSVHDIKQQLLNTVGTRSKLSKRDNVKSLMFGVSMGLVTLLVFLFGFFNERFLAPFISPSRNVSSTSIIIDPNQTAVGPEPKLIIPKINVEVPVVYDEPSINEASIQRALEKGVVWYPTTAAPGEIGNGVVFGHSANNILNSGKYKFVFVLLNKLENGDTFYVQKDGKRYAYRVFEKRIVSPSEVSVLTQTYPDKPATFTLITCDPPGTSVNRLVVVAEQISPNPASNVASKPKQPTGTAPAVIPSNSPSLWSRITGWF